VKHDIAAITSISNVRGGRRALLLRRLRGGGGTLLLERLSGQWRGLVRARRVAPGPDLIGFEDGCVGDSIKSVTKDVGPGPKILELTGSRRVSTLLPLILQHSCQFVFHKIIDFP
jgi:hypothetical protein